MRFSLFKGQSQYGSLRLHIDQLAAAFVEAGHQADVIDLLQPDGVARLNGALNSPPDAFVGIGGVGSDVRVGDQSAYDVIDRPYVSIYVDHPVHHIPRVTTRIRKHVAFFLDRSHVQFVSAWPAARGLAHLGFLPPGANELEEPVETTDNAFARRDIPVLFTGTYRGAPAPAWADWEPSPAREIVGEIGARMAADPGLPVLDALKAGLKDRGAALDGPLFDQFVPLLQAAQSFAEAYHRDAVLHALGRAGAPLRIYGNGWEPLLELYPSFVYGGVGSFEETLHLLRRTAIVLNTNNGFVAGGHERIFTAMCAGAAVVSDPSRYYADAFKVGREIAIFPNADAAAGVIQALLADPARLAAMARAGHARAMADHRWVDRAGRIVKAIKTLR